MPTVEGICEVSVLAAAERHMSGRCGTCGTCSHGYSCEHSDGMTDQDEAYLGAFDRTYLICLADRHEPCLVRRDEAHWGSECWAGAM